MEKRKNGNILPLVAAIFIVVGVFYWQSFSRGIIASASDSITELENKIKKEEAAKVKLEQQLGNIQTSVKTAQTEIQRTESLIKQTEENIDRKKKELEIASERINLQKKVLKSLVQEFYYNQQTPIMYSILNEDDLFKLFSEADQILNLNQKFYDTIEEIKQSRAEVEKQTKNIEEAKQNHEKLLDMKQDQKQDLLVEKVDTQKDINKKEATIGELQAELSKLKSNLSGYLGKAYNAKDVEDAASFASKASGVRKDFILGMLVVESNLGRFTGGCNAKDSNMSGARLKNFQSICEELNYSWKTRKVSCPPRSYKGTGGAMGVAQFMSDTWMGYKSLIASKTGHNPPDPWNLTDGVMAMGLKLARGGATSKKGECNAAKLYLSGTTSNTYNWYCEKVLYWADNYEAKLGS
ncbi:MAG: lytic murein transglycosylase [bacterium]|nr:lytic murein transglycosylase [bacterium]